MLKVSSDLQQNQLGPIVVDINRRKIILVSFESPEYELSIDAKIIFVRKLSPELRVDSFLHQNSIGFRFATVSLKHSAALVTKVRSGV